MINAKEHSLTLSTGRVIYTLEGRLTVGHNLKLGTHTGYMIVEQLEDQEPPLTSAERKEIRDYEVALWDTWANQS